MEDFVLGHVSGGEGGGQPGCGHELRRRRRRRGRTHKIWLWDVEIDETADKGGRGGEQRKAGDEGVHYSEGVESLSGHTHDRQTAVAMVVVELSRSQ